MCETGGSSDCHEKAHERLAWPEEKDENTSWVRQLYRRWTYNYMDNILDLGSKRALSGGANLVLEDLYQVPASMKSSLLSEEFKEHYQSNAGHKRRLIKTLWHVAKPSFIPAGFCQLLTVLCQVALPLLVRELLILLEKHPAEKVIAEGMPYAILLFAISVLNAFGNHRHRHLALKSGVRMRASLVSILYEHVLSLTPNGRTGLTSGEVSNLISVDTQKIFEVTQEGHLVWSLPLSVSLVTVFLLLIMGPSTLIGVGLLILFVPAIERLTAGIMSIREARVQMTDARVEITNAMLQGIKVTKLNNYEANYQARVTKIRDSELSLLRKELAVWALTLVATVSSPLIATAGTFTLYVLLDDGNILTASRTFSVLLLFAALRFPINYAGRLTGKAAQALSAARRISTFLERETRCTSESKNSGTGNRENEIESSAADMLNLSNAAFHVATSRQDGDSADGMDCGEKTERAFQVAKFDLSLVKGEVLAVCGPVAAGKSTFINGIIGEVPGSSQDTVSMNGKVAYVPQTPFILNSTLRENIIFGLPFNRKLYDRVIHACCLRKDIDQLGDAKDLTEIGERGVTLSGGQKQRVSLARAAYCQPDVVLLDDPLSALDAGTAKLVFERLLKSREAFFSNAAVVLVTHAAHFLNQVDRIIVIVGGRNCFMGTWKDLVEFTPGEAVTRRAIAALKNAVQEDEDDDGLERMTPQEEAMVTSSPAEEKEGVLMSVEEREHGLSSWSVWLLWFRRAGGLYFLSIQIISLIIDRSAYIAVEYWLARWTQAAGQPITVLGTEFPAQTEGRSAQYEYIRVYAILLVTSVLATILRSEWAVTGGSRASRRVFSTMLERVLYAPMSYFETTPMGRILNRFTFDIEVIDVLLTQVMSMFLISISWYVAGVALMCSILPWMISALVPVSVIYYYLLLHYRRTGADLQRLDAVSRSPIQAMTGECIDGSSTIRVFCQGQTFLQRFHVAVDANSSAMLNFISGQRWLGLRIELLGSIIVLVSSVFVISLNDVWKIDPGLVGLLILWSGNFTITLSFLVDTFAEVEAYITSIERVDAMSEVSQERPMKTDETHALPPSWPERGELSFENVRLRYRDGLPLALDHLSFTIPAGKSCGVVGRTGAGKSSLTVALFRITEIESGQIKLDGVNLANIGLRDVRGRPQGMAIIPQDPFLVGSTLRECLDPFGQNRDHDVLDALKAVNLAAPDDGIDILSTHVEEGGSNYSVGERQLLNLAAALLSRPTVLVLDEATASIDHSTDEFVQELLRERFKDTTLVTVAHRLNTIMDYDLILVLDQGSAVEMGHPAELLSQGGVFAELVDATGPEGSKALRAMTKI